MLDGENCFKKINFEVFLHYSSLDSCSIPRNTNAKKDGKRRIICWCCCIIKEQIGPLLRRRITINLMFDVVKLF